MAAAASGADHPLDYAGCTVHQEGLGQEELGVEVHWIERGECLERLEEVRRDG